MKEILSTKLSLFRDHFNNLKFFREPLFGSLKHGLTVFVALLFSLDFLEYIVGIIQEKPTTLLDKLDIATALVGFVLVFTWKFLERSYGKQ